jgi:hypothetical protein
MAELVNLNVDSGRNIIDDDAEATLELVNSNASGTALWANASAGGVGVNVDTTTGIGIDVDSTSGTGVDVLTAGTAAVLKSSASEGYAADLAHSVIASPTVAPLKITSSAASGVAMEFNVGLVSTASLTVHAGAIPVKLTGEDKVVYLVGYEIA